MCNVRRIPELIGKLMGISKKKKNFLPTLAWPDISNFGKHGFFLCDVLKKLLSKKKKKNCAISNVQQNGSRESQKWVDYFFEAQQKGGF